jgi:hypothetical protein
MIPSYNEALCSPSTKKYYLPVTLVLYKASATNATLELQDYVTMAHPQVGSVLQALMSITANLFREYPRIINDMHSAYIIKLDEVKKQLEKSGKC